MTTNQVSYLNILEQQRSHMAAEDENYRSHRVQEMLQQQSLAETNRANLAKESENALARMETQRSNLAKEAETQRSNLVKEDETNRSNRAKEAETMRSNLVSESQNAERLAQTAMEAASKVQDAETRAKTLKWTESQYLLDLVNPQAWLAAIGGGKGVASLVGLLGGK